MPRWVVGFATGTSFRLRKKPQGSGVNRTRGRPAEAICFYDRRYTLDQALTVIDLTTDEEDGEWLATGLPADRVIAYLRAGVTLDEYDDWENSDDSTDEALTMLAGFLQAP